MKIDCQSHVMPDEYVDIFTKNTQSPKMVRKTEDSVVTLVNDRPVLTSSMKKYDIDTKLKNMDEVGIDVSLLSPNIPGPCMLAPDLSLKGARIINNYIAEVITKYPGRFAGIACLPWQNAIEAIKEMDRARDDLGFCAVMLFSNIGGRPVDHIDFHPIFAHAEKKRLPIVIHPTFPKWGSEIKDYMMIPMMGFQVDSSFALLRLILSGIFEKCPQLQILMPHAGGVLPFMIGRVDYQTEVMGRKPEQITKPPSEYLKQIYLDTCSPSVESMQYAFDFSGPDKLMLGTDHPWVDPRFIIDLVEKMNISDQEKSQIFSGNAGKLFGLDS